MTKNGVPGSWYELEATDVEGNRLLEPSMGEMLRGRYLLLALRRDGHSLGRLGSSPPSSFMMDAGGSGKWMVERRRFAAESIGIRQV